MVATEWATGPGYIIGLTGSSLHFQIFLKRVLRDELANPRLGICPKFIEKLWNLAY
jgi:hypothetical protein